jgi:uncharacterized protein (DUF488 family)
MSRHCGSTKLLRGGKRPMEETTCSSPEYPHPIFTIGHSTRTLTEFLALLGDVRADLVIDVRSIPRSRTNPQFNIDALPETLAEVGIGYRHLLALGGRRRRPDSAKPSPNTLWLNASFQNYADYTATTAFRDGLKELAALASDKRCVIMCAEALWWRCHRRIIADHLLAKGFFVAHVMGHGKVVPAKFTLGIRALRDGTLTYPAFEKGLANGGHTFWRCTSWQWGHE